jgi:tRNA threonylcarbamoyladenosine biosynthesis protein TsaE
MIDPSDTAIHQEQLPDEAATVAFAKRLARLAAPGDVFALFGDLGAGKTALARAFINALPDEFGQPCAEEVPSPTFTLVQSYEAPGLEIWHVDLYRLGAPDEALELGLEEAHGEGALLIEWPERLGGLLPATRLDIRLAPGDAGGRIAQLGDPEGAWADRIAGLLA